MCKTGRSRSGQMTLTVVSAKISLVLGTCARRAGAVLFRWQGCVLHNKARCRECTHGGQEERKADRRSSAYME
eukprot:scaffold89455_cov15-Tisochrysis_lutea.AAC.1